jgi:hypothetical protein
MVEGKSLKSASEGLFCGLLDLEPYIISIKILDNMLDSESQIQLINSLCAGLSSAIIRDRMIERMGSVSIWYS